MARTFNFKVLFGLEGEVEGTVHSWAGKKALVVAMLHKYSVSETDMLAKPLEHMYLSSIHVHICLCQSLKLLHWHRLIKTGLHSLFSKPLFARRLCPTVGRLPCKYVPVCASFYLNFSLFWRPDVYFFAACHELLWAVDIWLYTRDGAHARSAAPLTNWRQHFLNMQLILVHSLRLFQT